MPVLDLPKLIKILDALKRRLHEFYVEERDFGLADALLMESQKVGRLVDQLKTLLPVSN
jgi:hypothetical protein